MASVLLQPPKRPQHVAIIMDGNGRWAAERGLPRREGHRQGIKAALRAAQAARQAQIPFLTLFGFSHENWLRPIAEVEGLLNLLHDHINKKKHELIGQGVRIKLIGQLWRLPASLKAEFTRLEQETQEFSELTLMIALSYGGRQDITSAAQRISVRVASGELKPEDITETLLAAELSTQNIPDPDLLIRTGGETRISNFLLWETAYSELLFLPLYWPDFTADDFAAALQEFCRRERRFGCLPAAKVVA